MGENEDPQAEERTESKLLWKMLIGAFAMWVGWFLLGLRGADGSGRLALMNDFGGWFNVISALFSSLALGGAIYAVITQQKELKLARMEYELTRIAQESNADSQKKMVLTSTYTTLLNSETIKGNNAAKTVETLRGERQAVQKAFKSIRAKCFVYTEEQYSNLQWRYAVEKVTDIDDEISYIKRRTGAFGTEKILDIYEKYKISVSAEIAAQSRLLEESLKKSHYYEKSLEELLEVIVETNSP